MTGIVTTCDAFEFMRRFPDESVDLILTDPPYESMRRWEGIGTTGRMGLGKKGSKADDPDKFFPTIANELLPAMLAEFHRLLKPNRHCYVMCDPPTLPFLYAAVPPFSNMKPLIWDKVAMGMGYHYRCRYEFVVMLDKGRNRRLADLSIPDVLAVKWDRKRLVPTQKPVRLFEIFISQSTEEGETVMDPFVGSGTTADAAANLGRRYLCCDIQERNVELALRRLRHVPRLLFDERRGDPFGNAATGALPEYALGDEREG